MSNQSLCMASVTDNMKVTADEQSCVLQWWHTFRDEEKSSGSDIIHTRQQHAQSTSPTVQHSYDWSLLQTIIQYTHTHTHRYRHVV